MISSIAEDLFPNIRCNVSVRIKMYLVSEYRCFFHIRDVGASLSRSCTFDRVYRIRKPSIYRYYSYLLPYTLLYRQCYLLTLPGTLLASTSSSEMVYTYVPGCVKEIFPKLIDTLVPLSGFIVISPFSHIRRLRCRCTLHAACIFSENTKCKFHHLPGNHVL